MEKEMIKICLADGSEISIVKKEGKYCAKVDGHVYFEHEDYETVRATLIAS
jgi:hypothetical protein